MPIPPWLATLTGYTGAAKATNNRREDGRFGFLSRAFGFLNSSEGAAQIGSDPETTGLMATNVEDALTELAARVGGGGIVCWAPDAESDGPGYYKDLADVAEALTHLVGNKTVKILWDPGAGSDPVWIPDGTLLIDAVIEGVAYSADTDTSYRAYESLLYLAGGYNRANPPWLRGLCGLRNVYFRGSDDGLQVNGEHGAVTENAEGTITFTTTGDSYEFSEKDIGKPIRIGYISPYNTYGSDADDNNNRGTFWITAVLDASTIQFVNGSGAVDANNGSIGWSLCTSIIIAEPGNSDPQVFILDNTDFYFGYNYDWGSMYVPNGLSQTIELRNAAAMHWFSLVCDGSTIIQSDGGASRIGYQAFAGNGAVTVFAMPGTELNINQSAINAFDYRQGYTFYIPDDNGKWQYSPNSVHDALDELAARVYAIEHP